MKQIVDKLNKIAKKIDESVEIPQTDLIIDSLDAITKAYGGTPNDSNLIVDKLEDIAGVAHSGITPSGNIEITENTAEGEPLNIAQYATATVNVSGGGGDLSTATVTLTNTLGFGGSSIIVTGAIVQEDEEYPCSTINAWCSTGVTKEIQVIMYKGRAEIIVEEENSSTATITYTGNCEPSYGAHRYWVTGDCAFTMA